MGIFGSLTYMIRDIRGGWNERKNLELPRVHSKLGKPNAITCVWEKNNANYQRLEGCQSGSHLAHHFLKFRRHIGPRE